MFLTISIIHQILNIFILGDPMIRFLIPHWVISYIILQFCFVVQDQKYVE